MAKHRNALKIEGFLASDLQVKTYNSGAKKARFTLEVQDEYKDNVTKSYLTVECWNKVADDFAQHKVGDHVRLEGSVAQSVYTNKKGETIDEGVIIKAMRYDWKVWNNNQGGNQGNQNRAPQNQGSRWDDSSDEAF